MPTPLTATVQRPSIPAPCRPTGPPRARANYRDRAEREPYRDERPVDADRSVTETEKAGVEPVSGVVAGAGQRSATAWLATGRA